MNQPKPVTVKDLTQDQRREIAQRYIENPGLKQTEIARWAQNEFGIEQISQSTISSIVAAHKANKAHGRLTLEQKVALCQEHERSGKSQAKLAEWTKNAFNLDKPLSQAAVSGILKRKSEFLSSDYIAKKSAKRCSNVRCEQMEKTLINWILDCQKRGICLTGEAIKAKGQRFLELLEVPKSEWISFSQGWLDKFKERHGLKLYRIHGESGAVNNELLAEALPAIKAVLAQYEPHNIFNMDETGLFYSMAPDKTIAMRQIEGAKKCKSRITVALTCNADGSERLPLVFIGHAKMPRPFQKKTGAELGLKYYHNKKAWMTGAIFQDWLLKLEKAMKSRDRKILLLIDNAPSHVLSNIELQYVRVQFLPPNATSKVQPLDAGIISAFKRRYRQGQIQEALARNENGETDIYKVSILQGMRWSEAAWRSISNATIKNCWRHTTLLEVDVCEEIIADEKDLDQAIQDGIRRLPIQTPLSLTELIEPNDEKEEHEVFDDQDFLDMVQDSSDDDDMETALPPVNPKEILQSLQVVLRYVEQEPEPNPDKMKVLYRLRKKTLEQIQRDREMRTSQTDIRSFFKGA